MKTLKEYIGEGILSGRENIKSNIEKDITSLNSSYYITMFTSNARKFKITKILLKN